MTENPTLLFVGCGNMGAAILGGALNAFASARFVAVEPQVERARGLLPEGAPVEFFTSPDEIPDIEPDLTVLAVKPQQFASLSDAILARQRRGVTISIMAGTAIATIAERLGSGRVARVMPNLPAQVGLSASVGFAAPDALSAEERAGVAQLFQGVGTFDWVGSEAEIDLCTAIAGSGPGYLFAFAEQMARAAVAQGLAPDLADRLVAQTLLGTAHLLMEDKRSAAELKASVSSPGGTTLAGLAVLERTGGLPDLVPECVDAAYRRARALAAGG